jgi:two-component system invasion response regulator UvrY
MSDLNCRQTLILAGVHPLIAEDCRFHAEATYELVALTADESTLLPAVDRLRPAVVVLDLLHVSSLQTIQRIVTISPSSRVVALTGVRHRDIVESVLSGGATGVLHRSDVSRELYAAVRTVETGRRFLSSVFMMKTFVHERKAGGHPTTNPLPMDELVLRLMLRGYSVSQIARALGLSLKTVRLSLAFLQQFYGVWTNDKLRDSIVAGKPEVGRRRAGPHDARARTSRLGRRSVQNQKGSLNG